MRLQASFFFSADEGLGPVKGWLEFSQPGKRWPAKEMLFCCKGSVRFGHPFMIGFLTVGPHKEKECLFCVCVCQRERERKSACVAVHGRFLAMDCWVHSMFLGRRSVCCKWK